MRCTMPISRSVGTTMKTTYSAAIMVTNTDAGSRRRISVPDNIREEQPPGHRKHDIEREKDGHRVATRRETARENPARRAHRADEERNEQRKQQERQHHLAGARPHRDRSEERRERGEPDVPEEQH